MHASESTCQPSDQEAYTNAYQEHNPNNFAYYIKYCNGDYKAPVKYPELDSARVFMKR